MAESRRFYNYGLEHTLHLEELERSISRRKNISAVSQKKAGTVRRLLARTLMKLVRRIDPAAVPVGNKAIQAV